MKPPPYAAATPPLDQPSIRIASGPPRRRRRDWIPTAGEDFFLLFRFYAPTTAFFDKTFRLPDVDLPP